MSTGCLSDLREIASAEGGSVRVNVIRVKGSAPNEVGCSMIVTENGFMGTVGGGALEMTALQAARDMLNDRTKNGQDGWQRLVRDFPLGPALGQCCGGQVRLMFEFLTTQEAGSIVSMVAGQPPKSILLRPVSSGYPMEIVENWKIGSADWPLGVRGVVRGMLSGSSPCVPTLVDGWYLEPLERHSNDLFLYGAGHVGRAVVRVFSGLPFDIYWVDTVAKRFPETVPPGVHQLVAANPADAARHAPSGAWHVVMTFSHAIDLDLCQTVLARGDFAYLGVIASKTKRARFVSMLRETGLSDETVARLHAPIGLMSLEGKEPSVIAISLAADLLLRLQQTANSEVQGTKVTSERGWG